MTANWNSLSGGPTKDPQEITTLSAAESVDERLFSNGERLSMRV